MPTQFTSTIALLIGNLLPIVGVVLWDWDVRSIITLYWSENLILGGIMLLKMGYLSGFKAIPNILFFLVHFGGFCAGHALFITELFAGDIPGGLTGEAQSAFNSDNPASFFTHAAGSIFGSAGTLWWWAFIALTVSHLVSFLLNWIGQQEYLQDTTGSLMTAPYRRLMVLQISMILGGLAVTEMGSPVYLVVVLVLVKIALDLLMHRREHSAPGRAFNRSAGPRGGGGKAPRPGARASTGSGDGDI